MTTNRGLLRKLRQQQKRDEFDAALVVLNQTPVSLPADKSSLAYGKAVADRIWAFHNICHHYGFCTRDCLACDALLVQAKEGALMTTFKEALINAGVDPYDQKQIVAWLQEHEGQEINELRFQRADGKREWRVIWID